MVSATIWLPGWNIVPGRSICLTNGCLFKQLNKKGGYLHCQLILAGSLLPWQLTLHVAFQAELKDSRV